jgi:hypothetical protein
MQSLPRNFIRAIVVAVFCFQWVALSSAMEPVGRAPMRTPFLDLLPGLKVSGMTADPFLKISSGAVAELPAVIYGAEVRIDLREQRYFSFIYSSCLQENVDLEFRNAAGQALVGGGPVTNSIRVTLPRTGGYPRLWTVALTNAVVQNGSDYLVRAMSLLPNPKPACLEIQALGFSADAPSGEAKVSIQSTNGVNEVFFYNGALQFAANVDSGWETLRSARNNFVSNGENSGFFSVLPFEIPIPAVNLDTNNPSAAPGGYMSVKVRAGFSMFSNQLRATNLVGVCITTNFIQGTLLNGAAVIKINEPLPFVPAGATNIVKGVLEKFGPIDPATIAVNVYENGEWTNPNETLAPGEGVIFFNPGEEFTLFFIMTPLTGILMNDVPAGYSVRGAMTPLSGGITSTHGYRPSVGDTVTRMDSLGTLTTFTYTATGWDPFEPSLNMGEAVLVNAKEATVWTRFFSVR